MPDLPIRLPWPVDFPDVVIHAEVTTRDSHVAYSRAKAGDREAALLLVEDTLSEPALERLQVIIGTRDALLLPVIADETLGFNAIPDAMAQRMGRIFGLAVESGDIVQVNKVGHTRAPAFQRLVTPARFDGLVRSGQDYVLIDDHVGLGGTLANLRGFLEARGGRVIGISTLTQSREARAIALRPSTRDLLWATHGKELDQLWLAQFGHGIDCLTEVEALQLCRRSSIAAIEDFLAKAAVEARGRGLSTALGFS